MGSSVLLHYFRNPVPFRVSSARRIIPPVYLVFGAFEKFLKTSYPEGHNPSIGVLAEEP